MNVSAVFFSGLLVVITALSLAGGAEANLLTNGDFSTGTLAGWGTDGNVTVVDYAGMPAKYMETWDLSAWNASLNGSFALINGTPSNLNTKTTQVTGSAPTLLSLDYAVAWSHPVIPDAGGNLFASGYFYVQTYGVTANGQAHSLTYNEVVWSATDQAIDKGVLTGILNTQNFILYPDLIFKEISLNISVHNPNQSLNQIVGIDNVNLSAPVPTPEPGTIFLLASGLVGFAGFRGRFKRFRNTQKNERSRARSTDDLAA